MAVSQVEVADVRVVSVNNCVERDNGAIDIVDGLGTDDGMDDGRPDELGNSLGCDVDQSDFPSLDCIDGMDDGRNDGVANSLGCGVGQ